MQIVLRKKSLSWSKPRPKRRRRTLLPKKCPSNSPLVKLFRHKAMAAVASDAVLMKTDIFLSAEELLSKLEGFVNNDCPKGASEFHERVGIAWQEVHFAGAVWSSWTQNPGVIEGLRDYSKTCAAEERVAAMKQDPFLLDILKASLSAKDAKAKNYVMLRGLLSILFVYWNDGDDLEKLFLAGNVMGMGVPSDDDDDDDDLPLPEFPFRNAECVSFVAEHPADLLVLKALLESKHGDDPDYVDQIFEEASGVLFPRLCRSGVQRRRIEVHYNTLGASLFRFFSEPKLEPSSGLDLQYCPS